MEQESWLRVEEIFKHLCDKTPSHRHDYLDIVCEQDLDLRRDLEAMLRAHDQINSGQTLPWEAPLQEAASSFDKPRAVGDYQILAELGRGGMGVVYKAQHPGYGEVALKLLPLFTLVSEVARQRFQLEARVLATIKHPAMCHLFECFTTADYAAIAMECINGKPLDKTIKEGPLAFEFSLTIMERLCGVLAVAHEQSLAHRDIKPSNVLMSDDGQIKLIDFGIVKFADTKLTATGQILGTPSYMSPEQWQGKGLDCRTDLWSLGVLWFEMLSGEKPFTGADRLAVAKKIVNEQAPKLPSGDIDNITLAEAQVIIDALLEKDPERRLSNAVELQTKIQELKTKPLK